MTYAKKHSFALVLFCLILFALLPANANAQINDTGKSKKDKTATQTEEEHVIYYKHKGSVILNFSNYIVNKRGYVSMPINLQPAMALGRNFTAGPVVSYYQVTNTTDDFNHSARILDNGTRYHEMILGVKTSYHLLPLAQKLIKKPMLVDYVDPYISVWVGYSLVFSKSASANPEFMSHNQKIRGGAALGVRSMVLPRFGLFLEMGYSSVGYGSFGLSVVLNE